MFVDFKSYLYPRIDKEMNHLTLKCNKSVSPEITSYPARKRLIIQDHCPHEKNYSVVCIHAIECIMHTRIDDLSLR